MFQYDSYSVKYGSMDKNFVEEDSTSMIILPYIIISRKVQGHLSTRKVFLKRCI